MIKQLFRKTVFTVFVFFFGITFSQALKNIKIIDEDEEKPISNARVILPDEVVYTNDDGLALVPENISNFEISKTGFQTEKLTKFSPVVKLRLLYKDIKEVTITNINIKKLFEDVGDHYSKRYYSKPSLYDIIFKQKYSFDDKLKSLMIAEAKYWTLSNTYNLKYDNKQDYDKFMQIELNNIKYYKFSKLDQDSIPQPNDGTKADYGSNLFFNYEIRRVLLHLNRSGTKYSGKIVASDDDQQTVLFKIETTSGIKVSGTLLYNPIDKVITHYELDFDQTGFPSYKVKAENGVEYDYQPGIGKISYDFYKKDKKYLPSQANIESDGYIIFKDQKHRKMYERKITFQTFREAKNENLPNRIDITKNLWENLPNQEQKDNRILLSKEEQEFINEK